MFTRRQQNFVIKNSSDQPLVHELKSDTSYYKNLLAAALILILGAITGYYLANSNQQKYLSKGGFGKVGSADQSVVGSTDNKTFKDSAEGELEAGGINGEGTHHLLRPGGESQTVALTSSVLDLSKFEGKKVRVWGETFAGSTAGWFMDVGKVEVLK